MSRKIKVLALSTRDWPFEGHALEETKNFPSDKYEVKLITMYNMYGGDSISLFPAYFRKIEKAIRYLINFFKVGKYKIRNKNSSYYIVNWDYSLVNAKQILRKYGDNPDIIVTYWVDGFISTKVIKDLFKITGATFIYDFVDEFPLSGICHYPCGCKNYIDNCSFCPAAPQFQDKIREQSINRVNQLYQIPKIILGTSYNCRQAEESLFFRGCKTIKYVTAPQIGKILTKEQSREKFNVPQDSFVVMFGALSVDNERKGFKYLKEALEILPTLVDNERKIIALIPGKLIGKIEVNGIEIKALGFLNKAELFDVYKASDVFVSPSIADAGPMMVNYSIALGTPVISFEVGVANDIVLPKSTGYIAEYRNSRSMAEGLKLFYEMPFEEKKKYQDNCLKLMEKIRNSPSYYEELYFYLTQ